MKILCYAILKVEGDILIDLNKMDLAIKCYKTLKDCCDNWGGLDKQKMLTYEQIAVCYRSQDKHNIAIEFFKKALCYAYYLKDYLAEVLYYERLAFCYMDIGEPYKMVKYYERAFENRIEEDRGAARVNASTFIEKQKLLLGKGAELQNKHGKEKSTVSSRGAH